MHEEIEAHGGLKLIYIDPPFDVGADFSMDIEIPTSLPPDKGGVGMTEGAKAESSNAEANSSIYLTPTQIGYDT